MKEMEVWTAEGQPQPPGEVEMNLPVPVVSAAPARAGMSGLRVLGGMTDTEFEANLVTLQKALNRVRRIKESVMRLGVHYGAIPGTTKPGEDPKFVLLKPGMQLLAKLFELVPEYRAHPTYRKAGEVERPPISVMVQCLMHYQTLDGPVVGMGHGTANSWEKKHRYRMAERSCPECGCIGTVVKGRQEYGGGWICFTKKGGCGAKWPDRSPEIEGQQLGQVENPDPYELENTLVKMAEKRSLGDGVQDATASSDLWTVDVEDMDGADLGIGSSVPKGLQGNPVPVACLSGNQQGALWKRAYGRLKELEITDEMMAGTIIESLCATFGVKHLDLLPEVQLEQAMAWVGGWLPPPTVVHMKPAVVVSVAPGTSTPGPSEQPSLDPKGPITEEQKKEIWRRNFVARKETALPEEEKYRPINDVLVDLEVRKVDDLTQEAVPTVLAALDAWGGPNRKRGGKRA